MARASAAESAPGRSRVGAVSTEATAQRAPMQPRVSGTLQPQLMVRAPARAAKTPPIENTAWKADMTGRP
ncbi:hypothetical protein ADZ36_22900 [Streptomyces fradiae]|uniref:Uncharacterized protein n=1 Tax=Streptomyces fradiae TaxID=1906 RepID=A0ACC4W6W0_STRFR|nr:hypothetical protein ADZ36_22900 [Streptomyces fradiae]OFA39782.1 hypothetical protein BEN35_26350 [Streptomyces fradiae]